MPSSRIKPALALASAATLASLSCGALVGAATAADPGHGQGASHGHHGQNGQSHGHQGQSTPSHGHQGQSGADHGHQGQSGASHGHQGQSGDSHGQSGETHGQSGADHGQSGADHGNQGQTGQGQGQGDGHNPPGNNGTVKIAGPGDAVGQPSNNPHPGCTFDVEWFGFDEGQDVVSTVTFTAQAPTSDVTIGGTSPSSVFVGGDPAGGGTDLDGRQAYTLTFSGGAPHPKQGYHVKLTVATPHSLGNDTKTKVFWVAPCTTDTGDTGGTGDTTGPGTGTGGGTDNGNGSPESPQGVEGIHAYAPGSGTNGSSSSVQGGVSAESATSGSAAVPTSVDAGENNPLPEWARSPLPLALMAAGLVIAGIAIARRATRA